jgi:hypothetical protein
MRSDLKMLVMDIPDALLWFVRKYGNIGVKGIVGDICSTIDEVYLDTPIADISLTGKESYKKYILVLSKELHPNDFTMLMNNAIISSDFIRIWKTLYEEFFAYFYLQGFIGYSITPHSFDEYKISFLCAKQT